MAFRSRNAQSDVFDIISFASEEVESIVSTQGSTAGMIDGWRSGGPFVQSAVVVDCG